MANNGKINELVRSDFEAAWIARTPLGIEDCLSAVSVEDRIPTLIELVLIDIEFRWKSRQESGESPKLLEEYVAQFPELKQPEILRVLLEEEYLIRKQFDDNPDASEFAKRFPGMVDELEITHSEPEDVDPSPSQMLLVPGTVVDKFTIVMEIGEGGMGSVFVAEQSEPVRRQVALKVIRRGLNSKEVIARFEAERQALAMMEHPNIARILDGGTTPDGQPYFVMELVQGVPVTEYCDKLRMGLNDRLRLFTDVCSAVQHAHQKGIIHRDLKPSNILVAEYDGVPIPKVIDFGLAKALDSQKLLTDKSMATHIGQVIGTFKYMSPEQADSSTIDIDTRTDVYALGVILYELLTGSTPLDQKTLQNNALLKILEMIRTHEPQRPSTKLSSLNESATAVSDLRRTDLSRLSQILRGDLDWVVMKALEKDRQRRYETASGFADDIHRFLENEPVLARPPSTLYKFQKFVRKNRGLVASLATIVTLLFAGIAGTSWFAVRANQSTHAEIQQRKIAEQKTREALEQKEIADQARGQAEASAKRSNEVLEIVGNSFRSANPNEGANAKMSAKDVLFNAQKSMEKSQLDELGKAELLETLTEAFIGLGEFGSAITTTKEHLAILETADQSDPVEWMRARLQLANGLMATGKIDEALEQQRKNLTDSRQQFGESHNMTLDALNLLGTILYKRGNYADSLKIREQTYDGRKQLLGEDHRETLRALGNLTISLHQAGRLDESLKLKEKVVDALTAKLGADHPTTLIEMNNLAATYAMAGRVQKSFELKEKLVELSEQRLGADHPQTLKAMSNLAIGYYQLRDYKKAVEINEQVLEIRKRTLGPDHRDTLTTAGNLSIFYDLSGREREALELQESTLEKKRQVFGNNHPTTLSEMANLAISYDHFERFEDANKLYQGAYDIYISTLGEKHPASIRAATNLASNLSKLGEDTKAIELYEVATKNGLESLGDTHPVTLAALANLAIKYSNAQRTEESIETDAIRLAAVFGKLEATNPLRIDAKKDLTRRFQQSFAMTSYFLSQSGYERAKAIPGLLLKKMDFAGDELLLPTRFLSQLPDFLQQKYQDSLNILEPLARDIEASESQQDDLANDVDVSIATCKLELGKSEDAGQLLERIGQRKSLGMLQRYRMEIVLADILARSGKVEEATKQATDSFESLEKMVPDLNWVQTWLVITAAQRVAMIFERVSQPDQASKWQDRAKKLAEDLKQQLETKPESSE